MAIFPEATKRKTAESDVDYWIIKTEPFGQYRWQQNHRREIKRLSVARSKTSDSWLHHRPGAQNEFPLGEPHPPLTGSSDMWFLKAWMHLQEVSSWQNHIGSNVKETGSMRWVRDSRRWLCDRWLSGRRRLCRSDGPDKPVHRLLDPEALDEDAGET